MLKGLIWLQESSCTTSGRSKNVFLLVSYFPSQLEEVLRFMQSNQIILI
jgi:hypothetical protein